MATGAIVNTLKNKGLIEPIEKFLGSGLGVYLTNVAKESAEEGAQELAQIAVENVGKYKSGLQLDSFKDVAMRVGDATLGSALGFGLLNAPASIYGGRYQSRPQTIFNEQTTMQSQVMPNMSQNPQIQSKVSQDLRYIDNEQVQQDKRQQAQNLQNIGDRLGIKVRLFDGEPHFNGRYLDGEMAINVNSPQSMNYVFAHEFLHFLRAQERTQDLNRFENFVLEHSREFLGNADLKTLIDRKIKEYAQYGENLTPYQAKEELIADGVGRLFEDERAIERLARVDENLFMRAWHFVEDMIAKLRGTAEEARFIRARQLFEKAARSSSGLLANTDNQAMMA